MNRIVYITNDGDDKNDGFVMPVRSWKRALKLKGGDNSIEMRIHGAAIKRVSKEIASKMETVEKGQVSLGSRRRSTYIAPTPDENPDADGERAAPDLKQFLQLEGDLLRGVGEKSVDCRADVLCLRPGPLLLWQMYDDRKR